MDYIKRLTEEVERGFSKSYLEKLIGLPKNTLASYLTGIKKMTAANEAMTIKFLTKNQNLDIADMPKRTRKFNLKKFEEALALEQESRSNPLINAASGRDASGVNEDETKGGSKKKEKSKTVHKLDPKEGSMAFMMKYGVLTYEELKNKTKWK